MRPHNHHEGHGHHHHFGAGRSSGHHGSGRGGLGESDDGRGGRRRRVFDASELRLLLLKLIADQPRHGYELMRAIEEMSGGSYIPSPGVVYPTLTMLHEMGQIEEAVSGRARKAFSVTPAGAEHLAARKAEVEALLARLGQFASARDRIDGGPIRRAVQNLRTVLMLRFDRDDVPPETIHQAAAILDEAAQRIERL